MVRTFVATAAGLDEVGTHPDITAASRALPHGSYTTFRTYEGRRVLRLEQHAERLSRSLPGAPALDATRLRAALTAALRIARLPESRLRLTYSPPRLFVSIEPFTPLAPSLYEHGVACATLRLQRRNPHAKDTHFVETASSSFATLPAGVSEGLMVAEDGTLLEGLSSNFFAVLDGELRSEEQRVLHGVTRSIVLEIARGIVPVRLEPVGRADLSRLSEAFLTSVSREILPVVRIDAAALGDGRPGPVTRQLMLRFGDVVAREAEALDVLY